MLLSFVLMAAAYVPRNVFKAKMGHPMVLSVKTWALAHLLANGNVADLVLFGAFLLWALASFKAARRRDLASGASYPAGTAAGNTGAVLAGLLAWAIFAFWLHGPLIGVRPFA